MGRPPKDIAGQKFGRLTVLKQTEERDNCNVVWLCKCTCGTKLLLPGRALMQGSSVSCGCYRRELGSANKTHGHTVEGKLSPEYQSWRAMIARCLDDTHPFFDRYGGRGITVCRRWHDFENFLHDMGSRPHGSQLDRTDNNKGYNRRNCKWVSQRANANNKSNNRVAVFNGRQYTVAQLARKLGVTRYYVKRDYVTQIRG